MQPAATFGQRLDALLPADPAQVTLSKVRKAVALLKTAEESPHGYANRRIGILSNYTTHYLADALRVALVTNKIWPELVEADHDQWELAPLNPQSELFTPPCDAYVMLLSSLGLAFTSQSEPEALARRIIRSVEAVLSRNSATLFLTLLEPLQEEFSVSSWARSWREQVNQLLLQRFQDDANVVCIDLAPVVQRIGAERWYAERYYVAAKVPFNPEVSYQLAQQLAAVVKQTVKRDCKLVVTDLDNTLWGGVVGEDGPDQVNLDHRDVGFAHLRLQRFLKGLRDRGVLLAIASKNDEAIALEVFRTRPEMLLKEEDFVAKAINWRPKSENIRSLLATLNLSTSGVWFLDDSEFERAEVRRALPELHVPELPADPVDWVPTLLASGKFEYARITDVDRERKAFYERERERQIEQQGAADYGEFLRSLDMELFLEPVEPNRERLVELINKTNQFNMTTRRRGWSAIEQLMEQGAKVLLYRLHDKHGSYGIISAVIAVPQPEATVKTYLIDTWVLSCRAIGRTVEHAIFDDLSTKLAADGAQRLLGEFIPTKKNGPSRDVYRSFGLQQLESEGEVETWACELTPARDALNEYIKVIQLEP